MNAVFWGSCWIGVSAAAVLVREQYALRLPCSNLSLCPFPEVVFLVSAAFSQLVFLEGSLGFVFLLVLLRLFFFFEFGLFF